MTAMMAQMKAIKAHLNAEGKILRAIIPSIFALQLEVLYNSAVFPPLPTKNLAGASLGGAVPKAAINIQVPLAYFQASVLQAQSCCT